MNHTLTLVALAFVFLIPASTRADEAGEKLAAQVIKASGGDAWTKVKRVRFTFRVTVADKVVLNARHDWDVAAGTDTVEWADKKVTIKLADKNDAADAKAAYQRWVNDSYWLLAPLKLRDPGVNVQLRDKEQVEGVQCDVLHLSFGKVGLTNGDQYRLYIDPETHLLRAWDYMPAPDKKTRGTWERYEKFGPLTLATRHQFGDKTISFADVSVE